MKKYEVWVEGYCCQGNEDPATYRGEVEADSFNDACIKILGNKLDKDKDGYIEHNGRYSVWGCRCYDNEIDARKSFG